MNKFIAESVSHYNLSITRQWLCVAGLCRCRVASDGEQGAVDLEHAGLRHHLHDGLQEAQVEVGLLQHEDAVRLVGRYESSEHDKWGAKVFPGRTLDLKIQNSERANKFWRVPLHSH